jgi:hypothetical protein
MPSRFEDMTLAQVQARTAGEGQVQRGRPVYFERPWTQVHDEMRNAEVTTVGELPDALIDALRSATGSA